MSKVSPEKTSKRTYGEGRVFRQKRKFADGSIVESGPYWIAYCRRGKPFRESAKTTNEKEARKLLKRRLHEIERPVYVGPSENKLGIEDLEKKVLADYDNNNRRSKKTVEFCFKPLKAFFVFDRLIEITPSRVEQYQKARLAENAARATINRECAYLRRGFKLLVESAEISGAPAIRLLQGENVRQGFINSGDLESLLKQLPSDDARDIAEFLFNSAWRSGEAKTLEWRDVDRDNGMIRLRVENSKNGKPRLLPLLGALTEIIERRAKKRRLDCPYVFHREGKQIRSFRRGFKSAAIAAGFGKIIKDEQTKIEKYVGITPHDMRRSAVRNFRKAGLSENEGMMLSGHKTNAVYRRYDIIDEQDLRESMAKVQDHLARQQNDAKIVSIKAAR
jgi:integrase